MDKSNLLVSFPDQSESFVHGFEAGIIWNKMEQGIETFEQNIHEENKDLVKEMCNKSGYTFSIQHQNGFNEWKWLVAFKKKSTEN
jgi:hypothetical protein